jgi:beta-barrel assembly-enhancing protease
MARLGLDIRSRWLAVALIACALCSANPALARSLPKPCKNAYSYEQEIAGGQQVRVEVYRQMPVLLDSSPVTQYVQALGEQLVEAAPGHRWPYEFHVVNESDINAFALPGGPIFVNLGTIQAAETEAQLAGALAHEIAHVVLRHATCNETRQRTPSKVADLSEKAVGVLMPGMVGALAQSGIGAAAGLGYLRMSRESEREADFLGVDMLYQAGYDPRGLPQFFEVIESHYGKGGVQWLSDHPNPGHRTEYVRRAIARLPHKTDLVRTSDDFQDVKKLVSGMHAYTARQIASGDWRKQAPTQTVGSSMNQAVDFTASGIWQNLNDTGFSVTYPGNWRVFDGPGSGVILAPGAGVKPAMDGDNAVIYGAIVDVYRPKQGSDLLSGTDQLVENLRQGNVGLAPTGTVADVTVDARPARSVELLNPGGSLAGGAEHDWLVALGRNDGSLSYMIFVAPEKDFISLRPTFEQILHSFRLRQ